MQSPYPRQSYRKLLIAKTMHLEPRRREAQRLSACGGLRPKPDGFRDDALEVPLLALALSSMNFSPTKSRTNDMENLSPKTGRRASNATHTRKLRIISEAQLP